MRELRQILARARELRSRGERGVLATVVAVEGSAYRREGARMLIELSDLPQELSGESLAPAPQLHVTEDGINFRGIVSEIEKSLILQSLELTNGNKARAAQLLDLKRTTFVEKWKRIQRGDLTC